ncbi:MAG: universal stress protein [Lentimicrobiaceae bacterium]|nr:universal stress protein [Lentimicrobiaceae bacterium]MBQ4548622.1 universal stress protein [Bacteroidales bacterium]
MKIILSTDFTDENKVLLPYAIDFLKDAGGEIIIFHAYMDNVFIGSNSYPGNMDADNYFTTEILVELERNSQLNMKEKTQYLVDLIKEEGADNITVRPVLVSGDPEEGLIELSKKEKPDLILMGTRGKGGKRFLEGSLVKSVMTKCDVPMLFIPEGYSWRESKEVVYATDFSEYDILTLERIFNILKPYKPHIHVIHFVEDSENPKEAIQMEQLEQAFLEKDFDGEIHFQLVHTDNAPQALKIFCERNDISLSSFIAYRKGFFDFIFRDKLDKDAFLNLNIPMLTFKDNE